MKAHILVMVLACGCTPKLAPAVVATLARHWTGAAFDGASYYAVDLVLAVDQAGAASGTVTMYGLSAHVDGAAQPDGSLRLVATDDGGAVVAAVWSGSRLAGGVRIPGGVLPVDVLSLTLNAEGAR